MTNADSGAVLATHESFSGHAEIKGASDRGFGLTVGGILAAFALYRIWAHGGSTVWWMVLGAGLALVLLGLVIPASLAPLNRAWMRLGLLLSKVVTPVVMGVVFFGVVTPTGFLMRARGRDPLRLKRDPAVRSYWIVRDPPGPAPETMSEQF